ncbi:hypothetical protein HYH02_005543 [Chlamydomonas schloesseri]|uniref:Uncharacterized protein n=1 Tax=Chlamydomonas schloesseri TaxID=2026947 RepID=A0A836B734_9CHLO|nr:hypothetical protein HYH02_005543 [Chlamydomonas schloesseri]|eukprot:KAG2449393.1 hypothetical protein HYH02_005543 [Chlamydomonas schloesseri]
MRRSAVALLAVVCACTAPWIALAAWGPSGNVVPNVVDLGPPLRCLPPPSKLDLSKEYDVFDKLIFQQIIQIAVQVGANPYIAQLSSWALASWNAVSLYDCKATPAIPLGISRRPVSQRTLLNRNKAVAAALMRMHGLVDPPLGAATRAIMASALPRGKSAFKLDPVCDGSDKSWDSPECVGIRAANVTYKWMMEAGWNYDGRLSRSVNARPYTDYTGYTPKNTPWDITAPCNWQPLHETDGRGKTWIQTHLIPYAANIKPFFLTPEDAARKVDMWNCQTPAVYKSQVDEVLRYSASLNDTLKMQAEILGPQPFVLITSMMLRENKKWTITDVLAFNLMSVIYIDAQMAIIGKEKIRHDGIRPASAVRYWYGTNNITAYAGAGQIKSYPGKDWVPYLGTFNEAEYPSGAVCWCTVLNEYYELWNGGESNPKAGVYDPPLTFSFQPGCSLREPEVSPTKPTSFTIKTTKEYIQRCKDARVIGGVHFRASVDAGDQVCSGITKNAWSKITALYPKIKGETC